MTQSIAVGSEEFVEKTKEKLGISTKGRRVLEIGKAFQLREPEVPYHSDFVIENDDIGAENSYLWNNN